MKITKAQYKAQNDDLQKTIAGLVEKLGGIENERKVMSANLTVQKKKADQWKAAMMALTMAMLADEGRIQ